MSSNRYWSEQNFYISGNFFQTRLLHSTLPGSIIQGECNIYVRSLFLHSPFCRAEGLCQHVAIKGEVEVGMLRIQSCDWSTRFMRVILLGLSLVSTNLRVLQHRCTVTGLQYKCTAVQLIQA